MAHFLKSLKQYPKVFFLPILSGLLVGTSFPPFPAWASLFCWAPLWIFCLQTHSWKDTFKAGWITQFLLTLIGFHWVAYTGHAFGGLPWVASIPVLLLFASLVHLHIPLAIVMGTQLFPAHKMPILVRLLAIALIQSLIERIWPMIFPWHMGYGWLYSRLEIFQLADLIGFEGLSTLLLIFNALLAWAYLLARQSKPKGLAVAAITLLIFFGLNILGAVLKKESPILAEIKTLIIQANIGQFEKIQSEINLKGGSQGGLQQLVLERYLDLTEKALQQYPDADVIVWPETALADYLDIEYLSKPRAMQLRGQILKWRKSLITGAYSRDSGTDRVYNGLFVFSPEGNLSGPAYRKSHLLAFGERLPFGDVFPWLYKLLPFVSSFQAGRGPQTTPLVTSQGTFLVAPQICYESLFPWFSREGVEQQAHLLVNITNDSWFGKKFEPFQHGTMTWARAIENRRPLIRATNTGQSSVVTQMGKVLIKSPLDSEWFAQVTLPIPDNKNLSFYTKTGHRDWILWLLILIFMWGGKSLYARKLSN